MVPTGQPFGLGISPLSIAAGPHFSAQLYAALYTEVLKVILYGEKG